MPRPRYPERFTLDSLSLAAQRLRPRDAKAVTSMEAAIAAFPNTADWYNNASFVLPLVATVVVAAFGILRRNPEALGFAAFLAVITTVMVPVVLAGWRNTATAVVLTRHEIASLHSGRLLKAVEWIHVREVRQRETQGNVRWEITTDDGEALLLDGEIDDLPRVVQLARQLSGLQPG